MRTVYYMPKEKKRKVLITGAGGFVGANLVRFLLKKKYTIHILQRTSAPSWRLKEISEQLIIHHADITDFFSTKNALQKAQPDYIIHLAAYGAYHYQTDLQKAIDVNIQGTKNLLEASKDIPYTCFINTGSSSEYGFKKKPMKETDFCNPISYYAATKLAATYLCKVFSQINNKPIVTLRLFSVYGPFEEPGRFIPAIMKALIQKETIHLTPGKQRRDFIVIDDVCRAYDDAMKKGNKISGEIFNIGTGEEYTNDEIVKRLFAVTHNKTAVQKGTYATRMWDTTHWRADLSYTKKLLNWEPRITIDKGLKNTYPWFINHIHFYHK